MVASLYKTGCFSLFGAFIASLRKPRLISKFMTSQAGQQIIRRNILPNISRSKGNQGIKFGQYNVRNFCLQKSCRKGGRETIFVFFQKSSI